MILVGFNQKQTVLLVEDDVMVRGVVCRILQRGGFEVLVADGGWRAIDVESDFKGKIDLLLSDLMMPDISAPDLAKNLNNRGP